VGATGLFWLSAAAAMGVALLPFGRDVVGLVIPAPELSAVVVRVPGIDGRAMDAAAALAERAGASRTFVALPDDHPLRGSVSPEPEGLEVDRAGAVRWWRGALLPLPEGIDGITRLEVAQVEVAPPGFLAGRSVVLVSADPAVGVPVRLGGVPGAEERGTALAVALGAEASGRMIRALPWWGYGVVGVVVGAAWGLVLRRAEAGAAIRRTGVALVVVGVSAVLARVASVDVGLTVLGCVVPTALGLRLWHILSVASRAMDDLAVSVGGSKDLPTVATSVPGRAELLQALLPDVEVRAFIGGTQAGLVPAFPVTHGEMALAPVSSPPDQVVQVDDAVLVPVRSEGAVVGMLALRGAHGVAAGDLALATAIASGDRVEAEVAHPDPVQRRADRTEASLARLVETTERWEGLVADAGVGFGVFAPDGSAIALGGPLAEGRDRSDPIPVIGVLSGLTGRPREEMLARVRVAYGADAPVRIAVPGDREAVLTAFGPPEARAGLVVHLVDVGAARRLDRMKSHLLGEAAAEIEAIIEVATRGGRPGRTGELRARDLATRMRNIAATDADFDPLGPVALEQTVRRAVLGLSAPTRARVDLRIGDHDTVVDGRPGALSHAVEVLAEDAVRQSGGATVEVFRDQGTVCVRVSERGGGLPTTVAMRLVGPDAVGPAGDAARALGTMGVRLEPTSDAGASSGFIFRLSHRDGSDPRASAARSPWIASA
jgi:hypothetical protein